MASPQEPIREILVYSRDWANTPEMRETAEAGLAVLDALEARVAALTQALDLVEHLADAAILALRGIDCEEGPHVERAVKYIEDLRAALRVGQEGEAPRG